MKIETEKESENMLVIGKKTLFALGAVIFIVVFCLAGGLYAVYPVFNSNDRTTIIVDAGHGEPDGGAVGVNGTLEKDINLAIAKKVEEVLLGKNINVIMTRMGDSGLYETQDATLRQKKREDMNTRLAIMKKSNADLFLSIHMNSFESGKVNGLHVFYAENHAEVEPLAVAIQERISQITGASTHAVKAAEKSLFLMKNPPIPAILVECGFLSNPEEEQKLNDEEYQSRIAWAIAEACEDFYNSY